MRDHVTVRVAGEPGLTREVNTREHERDALLESVSVDPDADAKLAHRAISASSRTRIWTVSASGQPCCTTAHGPRMIQTDAIPMFTAGNTSLSSRSPAYVMS